MHIYHNLNYLGDFPYSIDLIKKTYPQFNTNEHYFLEKKLNYPKIHNGNLIEKSIEELKIEGIEPLNDGEYIENGLIYKVEPPNNLLKKVWNPETKKWEEGATQEEVSNEIRRLEDKFIDLNEQKEKRIKYNFDTTEIEKEISEVEIRISWVSKINLI